jgi:hypothetical protein
LLSRKLLFWTAVGYAAIAVVAGAAIAGHSAASSVTTIKAISVAPQIKINRFVQDTLRWNHDVYTVPSGGTLHVVNVAADEGPHTFTVVAKKDAPRTATQMFRCQICEKLGKAHGADPNSNAPPKFPFLENGVGQATPENVDRPGDSGVIGTGKKGDFVNFKVTAKPGKTLYFICLIHPWMQSKVLVK